MKKLVFASSNEHKRSEIIAILPKNIELVNLTDLNIFEEIPETGETLEANATIKAKYVYDRTGLDCFAEDTGLEVFCLNNEPGVISARYAGPARNASDNMDLLLNKMGQESNRKAQFRTVIALIWQDEIYYFEGMVSGTIALNKSGSAGFGYDPVFIPDGFNQSFAELGDEIKNSISHRSVAVNKMMEFLKNQ